MAKLNKKDTAGGGSSSSVDNIFAQLVGQHNSGSNNMATLGSNMESEVKYWIPSGSLLLNMILSNDPKGGWPAGRIVEVYGKESIGKSTLAYCAMAEVQKAGGVAIYADIERAGNKKFMQMLGINLEELVITNEEVIEKLFQSIEDNLKFLVNNDIRSDKPKIIVVDSVTALQTDAEFEAGYEYNMNIQMKKAMMLGKALKKIIPYLNKANACLYLVNQIRDNTSGYGEKYVVPGGKSIPFYASVRLYLKGKQQLIAKDPIVEADYQRALKEWKAGGKKGKQPKKNKADEVTIGYEVEAYTKKCKVAPPDRTAHFRIIFNKGLFDQECYLDYAERFGLITKSGAWYEITHPELIATNGGQGYPKFYASGWLDLLMKNEELYNKLEQLLISKLTIPIDIDSSEFAIDAVDIEGGGDYDIDEEDEDYSVPDEED